MVKMMGKFKEQFHLSNLSLNHPHPHRFVTGQCRRTGLYGCWRVLWAVYHVSWVIVSWLVEPWGDRVWSERVKWFIYLTHWTYLLLALHTVLEALTFFWVCVFRKDILHQHQKTAMPWYLQLQWMLYNVVSTGSLMVTVWYWAVLHRGDKEMGALRIAFHALNSVYVLLNLLVTATPIRVLHCLYPLLYGVTYTLFTALYQLGGGSNLQGDRYVYRLTDWSRPALTLVTSSLSNFLAVPSMHLALFFLRWGVEKGWRCWRGTGGGGKGGKGGGVACVDLGERSTESGSVLGRTVS